MCCLGWTFMSGGKAMEQLLTVFITVVEKENFTRAAETLHMTQPAVSQYIQNLERTMGARLLDRNNKQVVMNKAGEIVYHYAKEIMGSYSQMQKLVDDLMNKAGGRLAIGASYTFGEYILPHIVAFLKSRYPLIKPKITIANTTRISEWVAIRQLDIGIVDGEVADVTMLQKLAAIPSRDTLLTMVAAGLMGTVRDFAICLDLHSQNLEK